MKSVVEIRDLSVVYGGKVRALDKVNLEIPARKITGLIGPSGSGKTTLIEAIVGQLKIDSRKITVLNFPAGATELRARVAYMPQELAIYTDLTVRQNLTYFAKILGMKNRLAKTRVREILAAVDLADKADALVANLSGGQEQRVSLAIAMLGRPEVLVLDEPTVGLDPVLVESLWKLFRELADGGATLIISSHSMSEAARCDHLVLLRASEMVFAGAPDELLANTGAKDIEKAFLKIAGGNCEMNYAAGNREIDFAKETAENSRNLKEDFSNSKFSGKSKILRPPAKRQSHFADNFEIQDDNNKISRKGRK